MDQLETVAFKVDVDNPLKIDPSSPTVAAFIMGGLLGLRVAEEVLGIGFDTVFDVVILKIRIILQGRKT